MESTPAQGNKASLPEPSLPEPSIPKPSMRERFNALLAEWGPLLIVVYLSIFALVFIGFALAIKFGFGFEGTSGAVGTWGAAYVATQLAKPLRIGATILITPPLGALLKRLRRKPATGAEVSESDVGEEPGRGPVTPPAPLNETPTGRS